MRIVPVGADSPIACPEASVPKKFLTEPTTNPESISSCLAASTLSPLASGTGSCLGPREINTFTTEFLKTLEPAAGSVRVMKPSGTVPLFSSNCSITTPSGSRASAADSKVRPVRSGTAASPPGPEENHHPEPAPPISAMTVKIVSQSFERLLDFSNLVAREEDDANSSISATSRTSVAPAGETKSRSRLIRAVLSISERVVVSPRDKSCLALAITGSRATAEAGRWLGFLAVVQSTISSKSSGTFEFTEDGAGMFSLACW